MYIWEREKLGEVQGAIRKLRSSIWSATAMKWTIYAFIGAIAMSVFTKMQLPVAEKVIYALMLVGTVAWLTRGLLDRPEIKDKRELLAVCKRARKTLLTGNEQIIKHIERLPFEQENILVMAWNGGLHTYDSHPRKNELIEALMAEFPKLTDWNEPEHMVDALITFGHGYMLGEVKEEPLPELGVDIVL